MIKKFFPLLLTSFIGLLLLWPFLNFQFAVAQGDHGRDLYAFEQTAKGQAPYRDYFWNYGPLMPYYYALFFQWMPVTITTVLSAKFLLQYLCGIALFLLARRLISPAGSVLTAVWFWVFQDDFIYTYNHAGGLLLIIASAWCLIGYLQQRTIFYAGGAMVFIFLLGLVKLNFGVVNLITALITLRRPIFLAFAGLIIAAWAGIYAIFLHGLSPAEMTQCLPFFGAMQPHHVPITKIPLVFFHNAWNDILSSPAKSIFFLVAAVSAIRMVILSRSKKNDAVALAVLALLYIMNMHEFIGSGTWYCTYWAQAILFLLGFLIIERAWRNANNVWRWTVWGVVALTTACSAVKMFQHIQSYKTPEHFMAHPKARIYTSQLTSHWIGTINETTGWLSTHLDKKEKFFALPYEPLYYYLTGQRSPTRMLVFFQIVHIPIEQEIRTIKDIEAHQVNYVLMSNYYKGEDDYRGTLGKSYCPLLAAYIFQNFTPVAQFGEWGDPPGWADHHGVVILKRK